MIKARWFLCTVLIGLIPFIIRTLIWLAFQSVDRAYVLNEVDIVTFGLVLHLSNLNELDDKNQTEKLWKMWNTGISIIMIVILSSLLGLAYIADILPKTVINKYAIQKIALVLSIISFFFSYSIFNRINRLYS